MSFWIFLFFYFLFWLLNLILFFVYWNYECWTYLCERKFNWLFMQFVQWQNIMCYFSFNIMSKIYRLLYQYIYSYIYCIIILLGRSYSHEKNHVFHVVKYFYDGEESNLAVKNYMKWVFYVVILWIINLVKLFT